MKALRIATAVLLATTLCGVSPLRTTLRGFTPQSSDRERGLELQFLAIPSQSGAIAEADVIGAHPHYAGTPGDYALAVYMRDQFRSFGLDADLESFTAQVDTPHKLVLELYPDGKTTQIRPRRQRTAREVHPLFGPRPTRPIKPIDFDLHEVPEASDPSTSDPGVSIPFNSGSGDGDVLAPLVFANRGVAADYEALARANVAVKGAIVLVRYGAQFRGNLAKRAQDHGAAGVIFYSDPADDGAARGPVYPYGPYRPSTAVQRGSVGEGIHIPTLPVSADTASVLLASLRGASGPPGWGGKLNVDYPVGRGPSLVHLVVKLDRKPTTLWNTIARIRGMQPQTVVLGAHRDAWVFGVGDNGAGVMTMLEVGRGLGYLLKNGWHPQRTIVLAGWDGEEIGLVGSHAYVKRHAIELERSCIAYINADENVVGPRIGADAAAAIAPVLLDAALSVDDPGPARQSLYDRWADQPRPHGARLISAPGGGSDHESFLFGIGIPTAQFGFEGPLGAYHSSYDTTRFATLFSDPSFALHRTVAQMYGLIAMRLADADVTPYTFGGYVPILRSGFARVAAMAMRDGTVSDLGDLKTAIDRYAAAAARIDPQIGAAAIDGEPELAAVHDLDSLVYGVNGYEAVAFPEVSAAFASRAQPQINAALVQAVAALSRATNDLAF